MDTFVARPDTVVVEVTGADRLTYLDDVTTQQLAGLPAGEVHGAMVLDAHGAPTAVFDVLALEDRTLLLVPAELRDEVVEVLGSRTFLLDAEFVQSEQAVLTLRGPEADKLAVDAGLPVEEGRVTEDGERLVVGRSDGIDVIGSTDVLDALEAELTDFGAARADEQTLDAWRVEAGVPEWGHEITPPHLPEELGLLPTHVHLAKGCYPGQEAVARMWMLGRPRRRLARVRISPPVERGFEAGSGRERVVVTTVGERHGDAVDALAFVPAGSSPGETLDAGTDGDPGHRIEVLDVVGEGREVPGHDPQMRRRRDQRQ